MHHTCIVHQVHDAMQAAAQQVARGENAHDTVADTVRRVLQSDAAIETIEYVSVADRSTMRECEKCEMGKCIISVALQMVDAQSRVRLIDNLLV